MTAGEPPTTGSTDSRTPSRITFPLPATDPAAPRDLRRVTGADLAPCSPRPYVWGVVYLAEAAARIVIVETQSAGTALTISKLLPYVVLAPLIAWMTIYGRRNRRKGRAAPSGA